MPLLRVFLLQQAGNGPPGGPAIQIYGCHLPTNNQQFLVAGGTIANGDSLCWASRASAPGALSYLYKPMAWDGSKAAVLLINVDTAPADLPVAFASVPGLVGAQCQVRDVWAHKDLGSFRWAYLCCAGAAALLRSHARRARDTRR